MAFPTDLTGFVDFVTVITAAHLNNLEAKVGVDGSAVVTSLDYLLKNPASLNPGHKHSLLDQLGINTGIVTPVTKLHLAESIDTSPRGIMSSQHNAGTDGARLHLRKSRGSLASPAIIVSGDHLGRLVASGYDGAAYQEMAGINFGTQGTIDAGRVPTYLAFLTATDASPSVLTERMRITAAGYVGIGMPPTTSLDVNGLIRAGGATTPTAGSGLELLFTGGIGYLRCYNRDTPGYLPIQLYGSYIALMQGSVGIGTASINAAALLHLTSTTKGFLPPVMTTAQRNAISTPPTGLMVFDSDMNKPYFRTATAWQTSGYELLFRGFNNAPADASTFYFGLNPSYGMGSTEGLNRIYINELAVKVIACTLVIYNLGTLATSEPSSIYLRINGTTDILISDAVRNNSTTVVITNYTLNIALVREDYFEFKWVSPTWVTDPTYVSITAKVHFV